MASTVVGKSAATAPPTVKEAWGPLVGDAPRIDTKGQIVSRKIGNGAKRQVWETKKREEGIYCIVDSLTS